MRECRTSHPSGQAGRPGRGRGGLRTRTRTARPRPLGKPVVGGLHEGGAALRTGTGASIMARLFDILGGVDWRAGHNCRGRSCRLQRLTADLHSRGRAASWVRGRQRRQRPGPSAAHGCAVQSSSQPLILMVGVSSRSRSPLQQRRLPASALRRRGPCPPVYQPRRRRRARIALPLARPHLGHAPSSPRPPARC